MATTTIGQTTDRARANKSLYWAIAIIIVALLAIAYTMNNRDVNTLSTPADEAPYTTPVNPSTPPPTGP